MTNEETKQHQEELMNLACTIGADIDDIEREAHSWHDNTYQRFMMTHPLVMDVLKHVLQNPSFMDKLRDAFDQEWYGEARGMWAINQGDASTEGEKQDELMKSVEACLAVCRKQIGLSAFFSESPDKLALANVVDGMGKLLWKMRYASMKNLRLDWNKEHLFDQGLHNVGGYVAVRPCGKEYEGKTFLGIMLGDFPTGVVYCRNAKDPYVIDVHLSHGNPAMYVPALKKTIFGCESWWHEIEKTEDLKDITDEDINSVWYVQAMKALDEKKEE